MTASRESVAEPPAPQTRMPDFFIIGHAKCGTTALYEMLRAHRDIYMPEYKGAAGKEPWFFSRDNPNPQEGGERSVDYTGRREMSREQYLSLFAGARPGQRVGEASTSYIWSKSAPARIAQARPDAKIIAILREPASFLRSLHQQLLVNHHESEKDFRRALALDEARREGRHIPSHSYWPQALIYSDRVRYVEQLRRYHAFFPREQVLVLIYDDFRRDNEGTVRQVLRFLEVDDTAPLAVLDTNLSIRVRSTRLNHLRRALRAGRNPLLRGLRNTGKALTTERLRAATFYALQRRLVYARPGRADERLMNELRHRFKPEVEELSEYLGRDFVTLWGYDRFG